MSIPLILGSGSKQRIDLLRSIHIEVDEIIPPNIDETPYKNEKPLDYVKRMAYEKNMFFEGKHQDAVILTADTVIACGRSILPKAETPETFSICMDKISGRRHKAITAICIRDIHQKRRIKAVTTTVKVKRLTPQEIKTFFHTQEWRDKAGGYALQGFFGQFIQTISGSYSGVVGLPVAQTASLLQTSGFKVFK